VTSYGIRVRRSRAGVGLYSSFLGFTRLVIIPLSLRAHVLPQPEFTKSADQATRYQIAGPELAWIESEKIAFIRLYYRNENTDCCNRK
jgi:hypothetical protein